MSPGSVKLGSAMLKVRSVDPARHFDEPNFTYIDIGAVDQDSKQVTGAKTIATAEAPSRARKLLKARDILVSTVRPNLNAVAVVPDHLAESVGSTGFCVLRPDPSMAHSPYLFHWVKSKTFIDEMGRKATGASYPAVSDRIIFDSEVPLPPLAEQRRIAATLDKAEELRVKRQNMIAKLNQLPQDIFVTMFGEPFTNPKGWPTFCLQDVLTFKNGINFSAEQKGKGILTLDVMNMYSDDIYVRLQDLYRVNTKVTNDRLLAKGDILFVRSSVKREGVAWPALFPGFSDPVTYCGFIIRGQPRAESQRFDPRFLVHCLRFSSMRLRLIAKSGQVAITNINQEQLGSMQVPVPPIELQEDFGSRVAVVEKLVRWNQDAERKLRAMRDALSDGIFRGQS